MSALAGAIYFIINRPTSPGQPLISDSLAQLFKNSQQDLVSGSDYSNVFDVSYTNDIINTYTIDKWDCMRMCNGTSGCEGFQMNPGESQCQTLSGVSKAWPFKTSGWNVFFKRNKLKRSAFDSALQGQAVSGTSLGDGGTTKEACTVACSANSKCKSITLLSSGCDLKDGSGTVLPQTGATTYILYDTDSTNVVIPTTPA
jgi:hypothetical protein